MDREPTDLLIALGASAAIISLVFRDTILGFVASIQISAQEMIRPGDWIEMPSRGADGMVSEINVTNVKVRNWDNSVSMIPTYALISESFTNWRNMQESEGRRFRRPLLIDINSVRPLSEEEIGEITRHECLEAAVVERMLEIAREVNTSPFMTNVGLYRSYIEAYLHHHPRVSQTQMRVVHYLDNTENGMTIQVYGFSVNKTLLDYEHDASDVMEHITAVAPIFGIRHYQRPMARAD